MEFKNRWFSFSEQHALFLEFTLYDVDPTDKEVDEFLEVQEYCLSKATKLHIVYYAAQVKYLKADMRIKIGNWMKANITPIQLYVEENAYLMHSMFGKMILSAIFIIQRPPFKYHIFTSEADLNEWKKKILLQKGA